MKRKISLILTLTMMLSLIFSTMVFAAEQKSNKIDYSGYTTVYLTGTKTAYLKVYAYNSNGKTVTRNDSIVVTLKDTNGKTISQFNSKNNSKIKLGNDHNVYRVYISGSTFNWAETKSRKVTKWTLKTDSNCTFDYGYSYQKKLDDKARANEPFPNPNLEYYITPKHAQNSVIDTNGGNSSKSEGSNIVLWNYGGGNYKSRMFKFVSVGGGWYKIVNVNNGLVLDVNCSNKNVALYKYHGGINQHWKLEAAGNGYYYIRTRVKDGNGTAYYLDVHGAYTSNGTNVEVCDLNRGNNQKFKLQVAVVTPNS